MTIRRTRPVQRPLPSVHRPLRNTYKLHSYGPTFMAMLKASASRRARKRPITLAKVNLPD